MMGSVSNKPHATGIGDVRQLWLCGHRALQGVRRTVPGQGVLMWRCLACSGEKKKGQHERR